MKPLHQLCNNNSNFNIKYYFTLASVWFYCFLGNTQTVIDYNQQVRACYKLATSLQLNNAQKLIAETKKSQPNNLALVHIDNYVDFLVLFISENENEYSKRINNKTIRLDYLDNHAIKDPLYNFIKAEILLQWALIDIKFDNKVKAGNAIFEAYKLLEENKKKYPNVLDNNKSLSLIHILAESVPKWVRKLIGVKGSASLGLEEIKNLNQYALTHENYFFREEVVAIYSYILFYQANNKNDAVELYNKYKIDIANNPLLGFLKASLQLRNGYNEACLKTLDQIKLNSSSLPFYYLDFMKGRSLLYKQDPRAKSYILTFVNNFKGKHFIKEAYQKLAWYEITIDKDEANYKVYMKDALNKGNDLTDEDKQALREAKSNTTPHPILLKSRMLFDGGYNDLAKDVLVTNKSQIKTKVHKIEYDYRIGRVFQAKQDFDSAIPYFKSTIQFADNKNYFGANAALQLGFIYEELKDITNAIKYYQYCLNQDPPEYKNSMHQKAKAGLNRLL